MIEITKKEYTIEELINDLKEIIDTTECKPDTKVLIGSGDIGNCVNHVYYNDDKDKDSFWHGEFVVIE